jgi:steroid 5-alpha reductase family enzyme
MKQEWYRSVKCWAYVIAALADTYSFVKHCLPWHQHSEAILGVMMLIGVYLALYFALRDYKKDPEEAWWRVRLGQPLWFFGMIALFALFAIQHLK